MSTNWDTADVLQTPMEICWQFSYEIDSEKLRSLYSKSKRLQWDAERDIDWTLPIDPSKPLIDEDQIRMEQVPFFQKLSKQTRETFRANVAAFQLSQFLHGEQGALMTAAALTHAVPDYEGKLYAATQTMDEARHVEVFNRYVDKLAEVYPIGTLLKELIDRTLTSDHWVKIAVGMNMVVEGLALGAFHNMRKATSCPLLRQVIEGVLRDEARHVAFGNVYVGQTIADMHEDDREDVADFAFEAICLTRKMRSRNAIPDESFLRVLEKSGIDPKDFFDGIIEARADGKHWDPPTGQVHAFKHLMMPALVRVGAVTERTRKKFGEVGIPVWDDKRVLEQMEDAEALAAG